MINTGIPGDIQKSLDNYAANQDSYSARNAVFQNLYKADQGMAADIAGQRTQGYDGLLGAIRQAYGLSGDEAAGLDTLSRLSTKGQNHQPRSRTGNRRRAAAAAGASFLATIRRAPFPSFSGDKEAHHGIV